MTLCIVWKDDRLIHFCSDSRVTFGNSHADVAVKVLCLPVKVFSPRDERGSRTLDYQSEFGMCFAGSAVNSLFIKESLAELVKELQYAPGYTDMSMRGLVSFMFNAYRHISVSICSTAIGGKGRAAIVIAGRCPRENELQAFLFETDSNNVATMKQVLKSPGEFELIGSGKMRAHSLLQGKPSAKTYLKALKSVIDDPAEEAVGGPIQYGTFEDDDFRCFGVPEFDGSSVRYWRAGLDINSEDFIGGFGNFITGFRLLDLSDSSA